MKAFLAVVGAILIAVASLDESRFWWWLVPGLLCYLTLLFGWESKCPRCGEWWAAVEGGYKVLDRWQESRDVPREEVIRDRRGQVISRRWRTKGVIVNGTKRRQHYACKYCRHEWTEIKVYRDR